MTHLTPTHISLSRLAGSVRIAGRRIELLWRVVPTWLQDGLTACAIAVPLWLLLVAVLLVF